MSRVKSLGPEVALGATPPMGESGVAPPWPKTGGASTPGGSPPIGEAPRGDAPCPLLAGAAEGVIGRGATGVLEAGADAPNSGELPNTGDMFPGNGGMGANGAGAAGAGDDGRGAAMKLGGVTMPGIEAGGCTFGGGALPTCGQAAGATGEGGRVPGSGAAVTGAENIRVNSPGPDSGGIGAGVGGPGGVIADGSPVSAGGLYDDMPPCVVLSDGY